MMRRLEGRSNTAARQAGWRRVTRQVWFCTWWTGRTACLFRIVPIALTGAVQLRTEGTSSCCYIVNAHKHPSWATSRKEGMACYSSRPMPSQATHEWRNSIHVLAQYLCMTEQTTRMHGYAHINAYIHSITFTESGMYEIIISITLLICRTDIFVGYKIMNIGLPS
jgi:hypothetical protein